MNRCVFSGFIGRKGIDLKTTANGKFVATYSLALATREKGKYEYVNMVTWGAQAEFLKNNEDRLKSLIVEARVSNRNYEKDGNKVYVTEFITDNVEVKEWQDGTSSAKNEDTGNNDFFPVEDDGDLIPF